jgi:hypothetical protein
MLYLGCPAVDDAPLLKRALRRGKAKTVQGRVQELLDRYTAYSENAPLLSGFAALVVNADEAAALKSLFKRMDPDRSLSSVRSALLACFMHESC